MFQRLDFAPCDRVPYYCSTKHGARQCRRTAVDEKEWEPVTVLLGYITMNPKSRKLMDSFSACRCDGFQYG